MIALIAAFLICSGVMLIVSYFTPAPDYNKIKDVVYDYDSSSNQNKGNIKIDKMLTGLLIMCVLIIWYIFS